MSETTQEKVIVKEEQTILEIVIDFAKKVIEKLVYEYLSYSRNTKIALYVMLFILLGFVLCAVWILGFGLGYTDMSNVYPFGLWIAGDLILVALGGGAFFTGFFLYIFRNDKLEPIINSTVLIGFMCYLFTLIFLAFDVGQPLRFWFGFAYPNWGEHLMPNSMLTEVFWCLTLYFLILCIELIPIALKHKFLDQFPLLHMLGHYMHRLMWMAAAAGTFLSFFHQGSLGGGMWGVLYGKANYFSPHFFFMVIVAAMAGGTSFMTLIPWIAQRITKKELIPQETFRSLTKISGVMFAFYFIFRIYDIYSAQTHYVPSFDRNFIDLWGGYYGIWMLVLEILLLFGPVILLNVKKFREQENMMIAGAACGVLAIIVSKMTVILHGFSTPNFPWKGFAAYNPTAQEWFILFGCLSLMVLIYMWFAKYIPLFPHAAHAEAHEHKETH